MPHHELVAAQCPSCKRIVRIRTPTFICCGLELSRPEPGTVVPTKRIPTSALGRYREARRKWKEAGSPVRTDEEIRGIISAHCKPCKWFSEGICTHGNCGCTLSLEAGGHLISRAIVMLATAVGAKPPIVEKVRMATEHCPIDKW